MSRLPPAEQEYADLLRQFVKSELKRGKMTYRELADRLTQHGIKETEQGITCKLQRGTFSAVFLCSVLDAVGRNPLPL